MTTGTLRGRFVGGRGSLGGRARARRWEWLAETFPDLADMSVIDLGGMAKAWQRAPVQPASVHVVNLRDQPDDLPSWITAEQGDACALPESVLAGSYDLVYSNSVIEHVGGHILRQRFAANVHRLADRHWVQVPYRYFPVEPHVIFPGFQFLPVTVRAGICRRWPLMPERPSSKAEAADYALGIELLSRTEMRGYFPGSTLRAERAGGLTKSLIAVKTA